MPHYFPHSFKARFAKCVEIRIKIVGKLAEDKRVINRTIMVGANAEEKRRMKDPLHGCYHNQNLFITLVWAKNGKNYVATQTHIRCCCCNGTLCRWEVTQPRNKYLRCVEQQITMSIFCMLVRIRQYRWIIILGKMNDANCQLEAHNDIIKLLLTFISVTVSVMSLWIYGCVDGIYETVANLPDWLNVVHLQLLSVSTLKIVILFVFSLDLDFPGYAKQWFAWNWVALNHCERSAKKK